MSECVSRRRFLTLIGAGAATVAGAGALYGFRRLTAGVGANGAAGRGGGRAAAAPGAPAPQRVNIETRYTPAGVPYLVAVALD